jgi:GxxExxY protein
LKVECEKAIAVYYDDVAVGDFSADMLVEDRVMLELKANQALAPANEVQLVNYLTATGIDIGLLLNFGAERLEFKRKSRTYRPKTSGPDVRVLKNFGL